jgi:predicted nucleic acid-binding protein
VLDANVLYPDALRDLLLELAARDLYEPRWSPRILNEVARIVAARLQIDRAEFERRTIARMNAAFPAALVVTTEAEEHGLDNHPKDRHVLAAAVVSKSGYIISADRRGFGGHAIAANAVRTAGPGTFLSVLLLNERDAMNDAIETVRTRRWRASSRDELLRHLSKDRGLRSFVMLARLVQ